MIVLGVAYNSEASAALLRDGQLVAAVSEERLNRKKLWYGMPRLAIDEVLRLAGLKLSQVDIVATYGDVNGCPDDEAFEAKEAAIQNSALADDVKASQIDVLRARKAHEHTVINERIPEYLRDVAALGRPTKVYFHHEAHAASAYFASGWDDCQVLTADGWGEDASATLWHAKGGQLLRRERTATIDSLGYFYGSITKALGFIPHRHEGKVTGLAAFSTGSESYPTIREMIDLHPDRQSFVGCIENGLYVPGYDNPNLEAFVREYSREDIAAATQKRLEEVVCNLIERLPGDNLRIALAGGVFANVKLNQKILALEKVDEVFIFPNMGDGGLSVGAAYLAHREKTGVSPSPLKNVYLGGEPDDGIEDAVQSSGLPTERPPDLEWRVAELIAKGHVVARAGGRMEFGPRSLGNRSIICAATDVTVNDWLNKRLKRSEFMPFAPATLAEDAESYFTGMAGGVRAGRFMTITFDCTDRMKKEAPAAVHIDGTARPQIVGSDDNTGFHKIISAYRDITGYGNLINTSFNIHEEPIVNTARDAIKAQVDSGLPYLALGPYLIENPDASQLLIARAGGQG